MIESGRWSVTPGRGAGVVPRGRAKTFGPILADLGHAGVPPSIVPAHNVVVR
jgi:hypothetical protein